jgi:hypothetical protein
MATATGCAPPWVVITTIWGERGLGDVEATADELAAQLVLAGHRRRGDDLPNYIMSFRLHSISAQKQKSGQLAVLTFKLNA